MSLRARVGRHTREGGRQCQNWADDQQKVTGLLNHIDTNNGGTQGKLNESFRPGVCSDALYGAISRFEDKHFPGQRNGYVDPASALLKRLEALAEASNAAPIAAPAQRSGETRLDILRRNVLLLPSVIGKFHGDARWTAGDRVQLDRLVQMASKHIAGLKQVNSAGQTLETLPWWGEVFGSVVLNVSRTYNYSSTPNGGVKYWSDKYSVKAQMQFGSLLRRPQVLATQELPALLLFSDGVCFPMQPYSFKSVDEMHQDALDGFARFL